ncbi:hypothetical protein WSM22_20950 [Cytophagales bacterium WSM2-2]|nr:hypothetical protein WSM22_20950 [Cytophagales bacterium WSM2-2]
MTPQEMMQEELKRLFIFAPPESLQRNLIYVLMDFLQKDKEDLPDNFKDISMDFFYLITFLQKVEEIQDK